MSPSESSSNLNGDISLSVLRGTSRCPLSVASTSTEGNGDDGCSSGDGGVSGICDGDGVKTVWRAGDGDGGREDRADAGSDDAVDGGNCSSARTGDVGVGSDDASSTKGSTTSSSSVGDAFIGDGGRSDEDSLSGDESRNGEDSFKGDGTRGGDDSRTGNGAGVGDVLFNGDISLSLFSARSRNHAAANADGDSSLCCCKAFAPGIPLGLGDKRSISVGRERVRR